jgi:hypothetical protein
VTRLVPRGSALQLALLRIVVPAMILTTVEVRHAARFAAMPAVLRVAPEGLAWFVAHVPITPHVASAAQAVCAFSAFCAMAGLQARLALVALTASTFYLLALGQLSGAVWHDMHLVWMPALLAASPCADALAYDHRGKSPAADSPRYGLPLTFARLLLGCVYFFPGFHKLHTSGLAWALSDNLRNQMWVKWAEHGIRDPLRLDRAPFLLHAGGLFVLALELSFPLLALVPRTRPWAALFGLAFHALAGFVLRIPFVSLWAMYVILIDPHAVVRAFRARFLPQKPPLAPALAPAPAPTPTPALAPAPAPTPTPTPALAPASASATETASATASETATAPASATPPATSTTTHPPTQPLPSTWIVGALLLTGAIIQGARGQMRSFPFACYPTFEWIAGTEIPDLLLEAEDADGRTVTLPHARDATGYRTQRQWGQIWSLAGVTSPVDRDRLRAYVMQALQDGRARTLARGAGRVRCWRVFDSVVPERRDDPPRRGAMIAVIPLTR